VAWLHSRPRAADAVLGVLLTVGAVVGQWMTPIDGVHFAHPGPESTLLAVAASLPVVWRRRAPYLVLVVTTVATALFTDLGYWSVLTGLGVLCATYTVAANRPIRWALLGLGTGLAVIWVAVALDPAGGVVASFVSSTLSLLVAFFIGRNVRTRRAYLAALEERARRADADRETVTRAAVAGERRRIARELHDVVAHNVSVMNVLAAGARRTVGRDPAVADEALHTLEHTGRATLREMRHLLDVLRVDDDPDTCPDEPQPGIAALQALVDQVREAGLPVDLILSGQPHALSPGVDLSAYRIVQEALTNTLKHAGRARATVRLDYQPDGLLVEVTDDGRGVGAALSTSDHSGHGLVGMRERVTLYDGTLHLGGRPGGGFVVRARLPVETEEEPSGRAASVTPAAARSQAAR
jgi:signal transduction histidine kinase